MAQAASARKPNILRRFIDYLRDVRAELRRVVWPTRDEVVNLSIVVITTLAIFIGLIFFFDQIVVWLVGVLESIGGR